MRFLYVMDPMCAWCYGFQPELEKFLATYPFTEVDWIMGGLAPDTNQPMNESLKQTISSYWYEIEKSTQVAFNHDYWRLNTPYRATYQACRAVISAEALVNKSAQKMAKSIQSSYYLDARNPSLEETLIDCAGSIGLDKKQFIDVFQSQQTEQVLQQHLHITHRFQVRGFPALFYINADKQVFPLTLGFCKTEELVAQFIRISEVTI